MDFLPIWGFWLGFALLLFAAEILTAGFFLFPFGLGAVAAALADLAHLSLAWQWGFFLAVTGIFLVFSRRLARAFGKDPGLRAGADRLIGMDGVVTETIDPHRNEGAVRVDNESWRAEPGDESVIHQGARVTIVAIRGARIIVRPKQT
ncbi:MAG: NfeD family protein [Gemmatimonadetes bacterium]|nr:NfeD family protein [Gemmatimonadota bacterium]